MKLLLTNECNEFDGIRFTDLQNNWLLLLTAVYIGTFLISNFENDQKFILYLDVK